MKKTEILLCAAVGTAGSQHGLGACIMHGRSHNIGFMTSAEHKKMAAVLEAHMKEEQQSVIFFSEGMKSITA